MTDALSIAFVALALGIGALPFLLTDGPSLAQRFRARWAPNAEDDLAAEVVRLIDDDDEAWVREPSPDRFSAFDSFTSRLRLVHGDMRIVASPDAWYLSALSANVTTARGTVTLNENNAQRVVDAIARRKRRIADGVAQDVADEVAA